MRWEKLFADLESQIDDEALTERDALIDDLREGELAATSWLQLCGGGVSLTVAGAGRLDGEILSVNEHLMRIETAQAQILVNPRAVLEVSGGGRRADPPSAVAARLGWPHAFRLCGRDQDRITVIRTDSSRRTGMVSAVGKDYVQIRDEVGGTVMIPFESIAVVSCPR